MVIYTIHWNAPHRLSESVGSLLASEGAPLEVVVIDNASSPLHAESLRQTLPAGVRLVELGENRGFAGAANVAWHDASQRGLEWFAVAAHDLIVRPDCIARLDRTLQVIEGYGVVGPVFWDETWSSPISTGGVWGREGGHNRTTWQDGDAHLMDADWLHGALLVIRTECADAVGGFREEFFAYCEDVDFCLRARERGWRAGVVRDAHAREPGHEVSDARHVYLIRRNALLMIRERVSLPEFLRVASRVGVAATRAAIGAALPWRGKVRRHNSWEYARGQAHGLLDALAGRTGPGWTG